MTDDRDRRWPRPRTPPSDSEPPDTVSGEISVDDSDEELLTLTPPPVELERLLHWTTRKLPNKLSELAAAIRHVKRMPADVERRVGELEMEIADIKGTSGDNGRLGTLTSRVEKLEAGTGKRSERNWQIVLILIAQAITFAAGLLFGKGG